MYIKVQVLSSKTPGQVLTIYNNVQILIRFITLCINIVRLPITLCKILITSSNTNFTYVNMTYRLKSTSKLNLELILRYNYVYVFETQMGDILIFPF